jgi:hypothetical protein
MSSSNESSSTSSTSNDSRSKPDGGAALDIVGSTVGGVVESTGAGGISLGGGADN